jgi:hypothetical protein
MNKKKQLDTLMEMDTGGDGMVDEVDFMVYMLKVQSINSTVYE